MLFATPDCSGTALLNAPDPTSFFSSASYTTDGFFHYPSAATPVSVGIQSYQNISGNRGLSGSCTSTSGTVSVVPAATAPAPTYVMPFRLVETLDVSPAPPVPTFNDVPTTDPAFRFIEALANSGITSGCQTSPPLYCPDNTVTRREMAVFLAVALGL